MLFALDPYDPEAPFPDVSQALRNPDGLLAIGGDLSPQRLTRAYRQGIFPWYSDDQPLLWWSPDPRAVLFPEQLNISRSLRKTIRKSLFTITFDCDFNAVIEACAAPREGESGTWITLQMQQAYRRLHDYGVAHSVEVWYDGVLAGGLYGLCIGTVFFGESMFARRTDASKVALVALVQRMQRWGLRLIDCQVSSAHLAKLGAEEIPRERFVGLLDEYCEQDLGCGIWEQQEESLHI